MMKHVFDENGIRYQMYDNSFFEISDIPKAQELADSFDSKSLCRQLDFFADFKCTDVFPFLGCKLDAKFQGEAVSDYYRRPEGFRSKFKMKSNRIKMDTFLLFETISQGKYLIKGFTNRDIRAELFSVESAVQKQSGKTDRLLPKLREHGIIEKIPHSQRYLLTSNGRRIMRARSLWEMDHV